PGIPSGIDGHHDALAAETARPLLHQFRTENGGGVDRHLVRTGPENPEHVLHGGNPSAHREGNAQLRGRFLDDIHHRPPSLLGSGNIQEDQLVGPFPVIQPGQFHRIPGIPQVDEGNPLHHPAILHIQTGNDPFRNPRPSSPISRDSRLKASPSSKSPVYRARPTTAPAMPSPACRANRSKSSASRTPPEAITRLPQARARERMASTLGPDKVPSLEISVKIKVSAPRRTISRANASAVTAVVSSQPWVATRPSRASIPRAIRSPYRARASRTNRGSSMAAEPRITRWTPASRNISSLSIDRTPPPAWMGMSTREAISRITGRLTGSP